MSKRRLGRGLDALLTEDPGDDESSEGVGFQVLPLDMIRPGAFQPRQHMEEAALQDLAESVRTQGIVQPVLVRASEEGGEYELIAGERRWRAAQLAGLETIPAIVRELSDDQALEIALIENIQREELTPVEEARAFERLTKEFGLTHDALAEAVGRKRATISNTLRLLRLPSEVQKALEEGDLRMGHARALLALEGDERLGEVAHEVVKKGLSVRATEDRVRKVAKEPGPRESAAKSAANRKDPDVERLERDLGERLGAKVRITQRQNRGRVEIEYSSLDDLEGIVAKIG
ncbi:ParB/RepB/Spo0J family partition protein [Thiohalorhabdus sp.]|uniref:ParB/RepB/Spo0J family partition protein n=1 Tax=Thiohalorhabdus sp. TaxID=3094134 RepID=UPI002FC2EDAC